MKKETATLIVTATVSSVAILSGVILLIVGPSGNADLAGGLIAAGILGAGLPSISSAWKAWKER